MRYFLYDAMNCATNPSRWMMGFWPSCILCSKCAACRATSCFSSGSKRLFSSRTSFRKITSGGTQFTNSSYRRPRICSNRFGLCSARVSLAICVTYASQSAPATTWSGVNGYCCTRHASRESKARRMFRSACSATRPASSAGKVSFSRRATSITSFSTASSEGAATLMGKHRLLTASSTFETELQIKIKRHACEYFSIVRRKPCCASFDSLSTSFKIKTLNPCFPVASIGLDFAISLITSCTTYLSLVPTSDGFISTW
mmetsp:Transcript_11332/g.42029  ORF Transcript_11332/g.42029 Transcript_11332/m.42029 type:complete len:258 (+) Transcript_11332:171-944(+)